MLILIGLGLFDERDVTLRGMEEAKKADRVYIELYTSKWHGDLKKLEKLIDKEIEVLTRKDLEENSEKIIEQAKNQSVAVFVQGDALVQTTHTSLIQEAKKLRIETKIIHNASIISAVGETGLHSQKFGSYVTIPFSEKTKGKLPESIYEIIKMNKSKGLHTLCLLDVVAEENKYMSVNEAMKILLAIEEKRKERVFTKETEVVVFARAGNDEKKIIYGKVGSLLEKDFGEPPAVLIITGLLHFTEKETLSLLYSEE